MKNFRLFLACCLGLVAVVGQGLGLSATLGEEAFASSFGDVVINEVAWAGSPDNSNDEWIELYNNTGAAVDLSGWSVEDDYASYYVIDSGVVPAHGYFLIEDTEGAVSNVIADAIVGLSLSNSGDSLILKDAADAVVDRVNSDGGAYAAGDNVSKASMERVDPNGDGDDSANFSDAVSGNGSKGSLGTSILGTPGSQNSVYAGPSSETSVEFDLSDETPMSGDSLSATVIVSGASDLFAYGFDLIYDPLVLEFASVSEDGFLNSGGTTAFNYALENGADGVLIVGNALIGASNGRTGSGNLFTVNFNVIGGDGDGSDLLFGGSSFLADSSADILATFRGDSVSVGSNSVSSVSELGLVAGSDLYGFDLSWMAPLDGADTYLIERGSFDGTFVQIGSTDQLSFADAGSGVVPGVSYIYRVRTVKNGVQSSALEVAGTETRGLVGDNNRSLRVDGRDIENLARLYGLEAVDAEFDPLVDTTFDGVIDGSDLIDIGANFGLTY